MAESRVKELVTFLASMDGTRDKVAVAKSVKDKFDLAQDRSVFYCDEFAIRFSQSNSQSFGNTVLSLSALQKYDNRPFIVGLVTPEKIHCLLANSTLLKKISHSSHELREDNIRGSFNGSDIFRELGGITNQSSNLEELFAIHLGVGFDENLTRLVNATSQIVATGHRFSVNDLEWRNIVESPTRAQNFQSSDDFLDLKTDLDSRVQRFEKEILRAGLIENVNLRGRVIEYLIAGEDEGLREEIISGLNHETFFIPKFGTENGLSDFSRQFPHFDTKTDLKTKVTTLSSNPKGYNIDKMLQYLSEERSIFMFYFLGIDSCKLVGAALTSVFQADLLRSTILLKHWAGRNSRGVTQFEGKAIQRLILNPNPTDEIDKEQALNFLVNLKNID